MRSLEIIQKLCGIGKTLGKIAFVVSIVGLCGAVIGILCLGFGGGDVIKIGGVTLHGLIGNRYGVDTKSIMAALSGWMVICAGRAVLAWFAGSYFKNELEAGTPFTPEGAKELTRLGIFTLAIPTGCAVAGSIIEGIAAGFMNVPGAAAMDSCFDNESSMVFGLMLLFVSLLCRYGAEVSGRQDT